MNEVVDESELPQISCTATTCSRPSRPDEHVCVLGGETRLCVFASGGDVPCTPMDMNI